MDFGFDDFDYDSVGNPIMEASDRDLWEAEEEATEEWLFYNDSYRW